MGNKKITFIINPNAATGSTGKQWPMIKALAREKLGSFEYHLTNGPEHAIKLTRIALEKGTEIVVCVGGDGTLNEVVNGFMGDEGPVNPDALLGYIPCGTGCDFIKTISLPKETERALDLIKCPDSQTIDLGRLHYRNHNGDFCHRYFHNVASFGLGGEVDERVNKTTRVFGGFFSFFWATLFCILAYNKKRIHLKVDDCFDQSVVSWNIAIANGQYHGGGMWVAPRLL